jgi:hypothetical protein
MPFLDQHNVPYYNPQVEEWDDSLIQKDNIAKEAASTLLFVIDDLTRAVMSIAEACHYIGMGRTVVVVVHDYHDDGARHGEVADMNRGRNFVKNVAASSKNARLFGTLDEALAHIVKPSSASSSCKLVGKPSHQGVQPFAPQPC